MDKQAAAKIIKDTFERPFDRGQFVHFAKNLLNKIDESKAFHARGYIPETFKDCVKTYERVGTFTDPENDKVDVLIIYLQKETLLEHARTSQRNFVARYLKDRGEKEAALVAFVSPDNEDWRFSLVKMDYTLEETPSGKTKVKTELTPARRWSFLVGKNESSHTAQSQLVAILADDKNDPTLPTLGNAFNIEVATREFFNRYRDLFLDVKDALNAVVKTDEKIREDFDAKDVDIVNFAKKLLGQIVFLYFLQKKGWFGVGRDENWGTGPKNFLRLLFEKKVVSYQNFFNDMLEPLFYEALRIDRRHDDDYYSRFNCKIPFLNGGLFDPINNYDWVHTDILLPNQLFSNNQKTKEEDVGTGILDVFDRYNFTVKEDEPLDKEVAVDPEMLGKVFENLLEVKDRKSKGTYYTPREIVHYMCQGSLINYLDTAVNTGEVPLVATPPPQSKLFGKPDPEQGALKAPGYRAIVPREDIEALVHMGELAIEHDTRVEAYGKETERYSYKLPESIRWNARLIDDKLASIRVCDPAIGSGAFPVGLMMEIARARNTLTTYLPDKECRTNYHFKHHAIQNCLYGVDIDPGAVEIAKLRLWLSLVVDEEDIKQIQPLPNLDYKIVCGNSLLGVKRDMFNDEFFKKLEELKPLYFNETNAKKKLKVRKQIDQLIRQITNDNETFDFEVYFSEVFHEKGGFDVVIANPPYVSYYSRESARTSEADRDLKILRKGFDFTKYEQKTGRLNLWMFFVEKFVRLVRGDGVSSFIVDVNFTKDVARNIRRYLVEHVSIKQFIYDLSEFEYVSSGQVVLIIQKDDERLENEICVKRALSDKGIEIEQKSVRSPNYNILMTSGDSIIQKLEHITRLGDIRELRLTTGVQIGGIELYKGKLVKDYFYRPSWDYKNVFPSVRIRSIQKYSKPDFEKGILFDYRLATEITQNTNKSAIVLNKYKDFLKREKVFIRQSAPAIMATIGEPKTCAEYSAFSLISDSKELHLRYLLALLNSKLITYFAIENVIILFRKGTQPQIRKSGLFKLPIKRIPSTDQYIFITLVDQILAITKEDDYHSDPTKQAKVKELERQIDQMVYELYGLTLEEIAVVEGSR